MKRRKCSMGMNWLDVMEHYRRTGHSAMEAIGPISQKGEWKCLICNAMKEPLYTTLHEEKEPPKETDEGTVVA
jgi:hypothetical protein